jgi:cell division protein FtsQ
MWDRPDLLNAAAGALCAAAAALALYAGTLALVRLPAFALREVRVVQPAAHVTPAQVEAIVRGLQGNFFTLDLAAARAAFGKLPWVRRVAVRRYWPDRLDVTLEEHVPLARWGDGALVNTQGEIFAGAYGGALPVFSGPAGTAKEIAIQYAYFRRSLATIGQVPAQVRVSPRRAWEVKLESGLTVELGREQIEARLERFVAAFGLTVGKLGRRIDYVDLRYPNGFAVRVPDLPVEKAPQRGKRGRAKAHA